MKLDPPVQDAMLTGRQGRRRARRWLLPSLLAAATCFSAFVGVAANLSVTPNRLGSSTTVIAACDTNGLTATLSYTYSATTGGYVIDSALLAGLANGCRNQDYSVSLVGASGLLATSTLANVPVGSFGGTNNANTLSLSFSSASPRVNAAAVVSVHVAITN